MRRLIPLCLLLTACASQYPPTGGGLVAPSAAPTASATIGLAPNAQATFDAAQLQLQQSNAATQAVIDTTQNAQHAVDTQRAGEQAATKWALDAMSTQLALSMTVEAYQVGATLTALYIQGEQLQSTATAQAVNAALVASIDERNKKRNFANTENNIVALAWVALIGSSSGLAVYGVKALIDRKRNAPYLLPGGAVVIDSPKKESPQEPEPMNSDTLLGLQFLDAALVYQEEHKDFPTTQIPSDERFKKAGFHVFVTGSGWENARKKFGNLLKSDDKGTFCREGDVQYLREQIERGKITLPYPIPARS